MLILKSKDKKNTNSRFKKLVKEYFLFSKVNGYRYLVEENRSNYEILMWIVILILTIIFSIFIVTLSYINYITNPTVTSQLPTRHPSSSIAFPAVSICPNSRFSKQLLINYSHYLYELQQNTTSILGTTIQEIYNLLLLFGTFYNYELSEDHFNKIDKMHTFLLEIFNNKYIISDIIGNITVKCDDYIKRCMWQGQIVECNKIFKMRKTYVGPCCSFNYERPTDEEFLHYTEMGMKIPRNTVLHNFGVGPSVGLTIVIDQMLNDYAFNFHSSLTTKIIIFNSEEFPDLNSGSARERYINPGRELFLNIVPTATYGALDMKDIRYTDRGCVFNDEIDLIYDDFYSYSECNLVCQIDNILGYCGCIPFYLPNIYKSNICLLNDLPCLIKWKERWYNSEPIFNNNNNKESKSNFRCPSCIPTCNNIVYKIKTSWAYINPINLQQRSYKPKFVDNIRIQNFSILNIFYGAAFVTENIQTIQNTWFELLSMFGGLCGLTIGASMISIIEIFYYLTLKFGFYR